MAPRLTIHFIVKWQNATQAQVDRLLEHARRHDRDGFDARVGRPLFEEEIDGEFLISALHRLSLALAWQQGKRSTWWPKPTQSALDRVKRSLEVLVPDSSMRDVIEHYDAYAAGRGGNKEPFKGRRTAYVGTSLGSTPDEPGSEDAQVVMSLRGIEPFGCVDIPPVYSLDAAAVGDWLDVEISPLIDLLVTTEREFHYCSEGPPYY